MKHWIASLLALGIAYSAFAAQPVEVRDAWVRATVAKQQATGAFMKITAAEPVRLVAASSPAAPIVEIHEMVMERDTMKMRAIPALPIGAQETAELKPGGHHIMFINLPKPIEAGEEVPITLVFETAKGERFEVAVKAVARALGATPHGGSSGMQHHGRAAH